MHARNATALALLRGLVPHPCRIGLDSGCGSTNLQAGVESNPTPHSAGACLADCATIFGQCKHSLVLLSSHSSQLRLVDPDILVTLDHSRTYRAWITSTEESNRVWSISARILQEMFNPNLVLQSFQAPLILKSGGTLQLDSCPHKARRL